MFLTYQELLAIKEMEDAEVVAGREGMNKAIRWCHVIEIKKPGKWATPNLLVFATGVALTDDIENGLLQMVESLAEQKASGLVLGIGVYIPCVPESVIRLADEKRLPIITLPEKARFADISFRVGNLIFEKMATNNRQHLLLENVLTSGGTDSYDAELEYYGYLRGVPYRIAVIHKNGKGRIAPEVSDALQMEISGIRNKIQRKIFFLNRMNQYILLIPDTSSVSEYSFEDIMGDIDRLMQREMGDGQYQIAISDWAEQSSALAACYEQTRVIYEKGRYLFPERRVVHYADLGIFCMVDLSRTAELEQLMNSALGELAEDAELIGTLQTYIDCNMNMQAAADALFVHINTMKYRLKKINEMLPHGLLKSRVFQIQTGLYLYRILNIV